MQNRGNYVYVEREREVQVHARFSGNLDSRVYGNLPRFDCEKTNLNRNGLPAMTRVLSILF